MSAIDTEPFPRGALLAAGAMIGIALTATALVRVERLSAPAVVAVQAPPVQFVDLSFSDQPDGSVLVRDVQTDTRLATLAPGTNGFIRGVLRGLAHNRKMHKIGQEPPFRLAEWPHGRLSLEDTATGRTIDLQSFGKDNRAAFARLLPRAPAAS
jgi:putative photosynthetic complex assembly protein